MKKFLLLIPFFLLAVAVAQPPASTLPLGSQPLGNQPLGSKWSLQSSARVMATGEAISSASFQTASGNDDWMQVDVPTTVVAAQVKNGLLPDPFYGMNLRRYPGLTYPIGFNFSNLPMPPDSPYAISWWYRKEFTLPNVNEFAGKTVWLNFRGINYRANIFLNGKQIADSNEVAGAWRTYEFNVTSSIKPGTNVLAVQVWAPTENNLAITFVDWNPAPPDKNMGLFREVYLTTSGPVALRHPAVLSKVDSPAGDAHDRAHLTVTTLVKNSSDRAIKGTLKGRIENIEFAQTVELAAGESKDVVFASARYPQLNLDNPRLWWPAQMGTPNLYDLSLSFEVNGATSDAAQTKFGIREITSEVAEQSPDRFKRLFKVNGKKILIRGGGWTPDMMVRETPGRLADEFQYVRDLGLNTVRLEGKLETEEFFEMADQQGILVMAGWCCCDFWEHWGNWKDEDFGIAKASLRDQMYRLRGHPSLLAWLNGSDNPPPPDVEEMYLKVESDLRWPNPVVSSATAKTTTVTGESGVKMSGPYEYVAPAYWTTDPYLQKKEDLCNPGGCGGAYGFNTETSMGPAVPPIESIERMIPTDHLWTANGPLDEYWNFHAGGGKFKSVQVFADALNARYGKAQSAEDFAYKSQIMTYEGVRAMYEAYSRDKYTSTGVIQWMLNNAWPSTIWHLYDYYLRPGGGYFGAKKAMQRLDPIYGYDDHSIWLVSSQYVDAKRLKLTARVFNLDGTQKFAKEAALDAAADSTAKVFELPQIEGLSPTYFLDLRVTDSGGKLVGSNFYWLSTKPETLDWAKSNWWTTPTSSYADYTSLTQLPKVRLNVSSRSETHGEDAVTRVTVENPSKTVAFFVRLKLDKGKGGEEILPVVWQDNYMSLLPGEKRDITATYHSSSLGEATPAVEVSGWNLE
ncbi:MAG: glycoside hydrolase family 2 protein [Terriglobales bacterium]